MRKFTTIISILACWSLCAVTTLADIQTGTKAGQSYHLKLIEPNKLKEDLDFLFKTIEEVHPNMYAYICEEKYIKIKEEFYKHIDYAMSISEFWIYVRTVVSCLKDSQQGEYI